MNQTQTPEISPSCLGLILLFSGFMFLAGGCSLYIMFKEKKQEQDRQEEYRKYHEMWRDWEDRNMSN